MADKITSVSKNYPKEFHSQNEDEIKLSKERHISPKKDNKLLMN